MTQTIERVEDIGSAIRAARQAKGWSQVRLAREVGVSQGAISNWESGYRLPEWARLLVIAAALGLALALVRRGGAVPRL